MKKLITSVALVVAIGIIPTTIMATTNNRSLEKLESSLQVKIEELQDKMKKIEGIEIPTMVLDEETPTPTPIAEEYNQDDLYWLSRIISAEARGESQEGQIAVGNVVMNRVAHKNFPNTIKGVIFQKGQFSPVSNGSIYKEPYEIAVESAKKVLSGERVVGEDAIYFYGHKVVSRGSWIRTRPTIKDIGNHRFAR